MRLIYKRMLGAAGGIILGTGLILNTGVHVCGYWQGARNSHKDYEDGSLKDEWFDYAMFHADRLGDTFTLAIPFHCFYKSPEKPPIE